MTNMLIGVEERRAVERSSAGTEMDLPIIKNSSPQEPLRFLSEASAVLLSSLDPEITLANVASLAVPDLGDASVLDLLTEDGSVRRIARAHHDPVKEPWFDEFQRLHPPELGGGGPIARAMRTGQPDILGHPADSRPAAAAKGALPLTVLPATGFGSCMVLPLAANGRSLGTLSLVAVRAGRYRRADLALAQEFANRAALAIDNARLHQETREADRRKDRFLATLAHELRNPLSVIRNAAHRLRLPGMDGAALEWVGDVLERQVGQMTHLIESVLDIARITHGKMQLHKERVDLTAIIGRVAETTPSISTKAPMQLTVRFPPEPVWVEADPSRLEQVLMNVLNNAIKYTEPGGHVWLTAEQENGEAVVRVRDNGIGISPEMLPRIFDLFAQAETARERSPGGLGIGLALVRSLVEMHGGSVQALSDGPGKGSEFVVRLPSSPEVRRPGVPINEDDGLPVACSRNSRGG
jgi:signal transduction histidine kinase